MELKKNEKVFTPVTLEITFKTEEELNAFYALSCTHTSVPIRVKSVHPEKLPREQILNDMLYNIATFIENNIF